MQVLRLSVNGHSLEKQLQDAFKSLHWQKIDSVPRGFHSGLIWSPLYECQDVIDTVLALVLVGHCGGVKIASELSDIGYKLNSATVPPTASSNNGRAACRGRTHSLFRLLNKHFQKTFIVLNRKVVAEEVWNPKQEGKGGYGNQ